MGIVIEFNPDLALRKYGTAGRKKEECLPKKLEEDKVYRFLKEGQRNYWFDGELPLLETEGDQKLSRPLASITIIDATHFKRKGKVFTKGRYLVNKIFYIDDSRIHFESYKRIN